ncbi:SH3 domain-containing protein [Sulfurimonas sp. SAG-AH-194-I05]|nr:SH3 domain-containing C40 family peptidase [Sulfurimonas sp. SAG-AH-194-I05]MDF1874915.1 SH3 domain-containing protein [Sulfurimonas sp. SAG-AH-194-I05]
MKYTSLVLVSFLLTGCMSPTLQHNVERTHEAIKKKKKSYSTTPDDLQTFPQNVKEYTKNIHTDSLYTIQNNYEKSYFRMWNITKPKATLEDIKWPFYIYHENNSYGENLLPRDERFFNTMYKKSNFDAYLTINKKALTLKHVNLRAMPTMKPILRDPKIAGEGFPFDYLQNSSVNANVPLFVSHYSKDKQWVFVFTSFTHGWLKSDSIVLIKNKHAKKWKNAEQIFITKEGVPLYTKKGKALFDTKIGMMFALVKEDENFFTVLSISSYKNQYPMFNTSKIPKNIASKTALRLNTKNLNTIISEIVDSKYGWGGMFEQRDCSSTLMDLYTPFGIWLPRNSSNQAKVGQVTDLSNFNDEEKEKYIKENAIAFETFLYKRGHIVLYTGIYNNEITILQNVWGIRTIKNTIEGRYIIGKVVFSSLKFGKNIENYNKKKELLHTITSMNIITR